MEQQSKNFQRYLDWYVRGSISDYQLIELKEAGLITETEYGIILDAKKIEQ